jgi:hypothetical protein
VQSDLVQRIAELVDAKQLDGITDVRDESDRTGEAPFPPTQWGSLHHMTFLCCQHALSHILLGVAD